MSTTGWRLVAAALPPKDSDPTPRCANTSTTSTAVALATPAATDRTMYRNEAMMPRSLAHWHDRLLASLPGSSQFGFSRLCRTSLVRAADPSRRHGANLGSTTLLRCVSSPTLSAMRTTDPTHDEGTRDEYRQKEYPISASRRPARTRDARPTINTAALAAIARAARSEQRRAMRARTGVSSGARPIAGGRWVVRWRRSKHPRVSHSRYRRGAVNRAGSRGRDGRADGQPGRARGGTRTKDDGGADRASGGGRPCERKAVG
jgi:hypothetical protein